MALFNIFSDPALKARQDLLDAQWTSLYSLQQGCDDFPSQSWVEFINDYKAWKVFYESGSDWAQSSEKATNEYQVKAQEWAKRMGASGCSGTVGSVGGVDVPSFGDSGIPGVKDPPPLTPGLLDEVVDGFEKVTDAAASPFKTLGWVAVGIVAAVLIAIVIITTKGHASGYGVAVGKGG